MEKRQLYISIGEWLEEHKKNSVKPLTYDRLMIAYKLMMKYSISDWRVNEIDSKAMQRYLNDLVSDGYSMSTIKKQFNLITAYWKYGMSQGQITTPVYLGVNLPSEERLTRKVKEIDTYTHGEQKKLLGELVKLEKPQYGVIVLLLEAGLRVGEALALTWNDILWSRKAVYVRGTLIRLSAERGVSYVQDSPKSKTSRRKVPLSNTAMEVLEKLYKDRDGDGLIFARKDDASLPYSYSSVEFHTRKLCKQLGVPYKGMHAFRHTFATNCYERGCDVKILSKLLGHADVAITYNIYIHLYGDELEEMRKALG